MAEFDSHREVSSCLAIGRQNSGRPATCCSKEAMHDEDDEEEDSVRISLHPLAEELSTMMAGEVAAPS